MKHNHRRPRTDTHRLVVWIDPALRDELVAVASAHGRSMSGEVRYALRQWLKRHEHAEVEPSC